MIHKVFHVERSMPNIIFYNNNCGLYRHLVAVGDNLYKTVGLPVDVFHWQCKHKKSVMRPHIAYAHNDTCATLLR